MKQFIITPAAGKRLIAKALVSHPKILSALKTTTIVILAGTTNGYITEEIIKKMRYNVDFSKNTFIRGITLPPKKPTTKQGRLPNQI